MGQRPSDRMVTSQVVGEEPVWGRAGLLTVVRRVTRHKTYLTIKEVTATLCRDIFM